MLAPVVLFVYNRLEHTKETIATLAKNELAKESELYVFSDAAKNENVKVKVDAVRAFVREDEWKKSFKKVTIIEASENKGLAKSIIGGVTELINEYGKVIVIEDDLILSPFFLNYMNGALDFYENDPEIWSISGYSFPMKSLKKYLHDVFYSYRGSSWGWATWADRWAMNDWNVSDYDKFVKDEQWQKRFNRGGGDLTGMLALQMAGKIDSWAVRWCFEESNRNMYTIYPKHSYLGNEGLDGSGTNCGVENGKTSMKEEDSFKCKFEKLGPDKKLIREFYLYYTDTLDKKIIRNLKKIKRKVLGE